MHDQESIRAFAPQSMNVSVDQRDMDHKIVIFDRQLTYIINLI